MSKIIINASFAEAIDRILWLDGLIKNSKPELRCVVIDIEDKTLDEINSLVNAIENVVSARFCEGELEVTRLQTTMEQENDLYNWKQNINYWLRKLDNWKQTKQEWQTMIDDWIAYKGIVLPQPYNLDDE